MDEQTLTGQEISRIQRAASYAGFDWQLICTRPVIALAFCERIEAEMQRDGIDVKQPSQSTDRTMATPAEPELVGLA